MMRDYHINIFYSDDEGYIADIPDLEACSARGETSRLRLSDTRMTDPPEQTCTCQPQTFAGC